MRHWNSRAQDSGSLHCLGNGLVCAYGQGPAIAQIFGPPYSAPSLLRLDMDTGGEADSVSVREPGTAIWRHQIAVDGIEAATFTDFLPPGLPCFIRTVDCHREFTWTLQLESCAQALVNADQFAGAGTALLAWAEPGVSIYGKYPTTAWQYLQVLGTGGISCRQTAAGVFDLAVSPGRSTLLLVCGQSYPELIQAAELLLQTQPERLLADTQQWWQAFTDRRRNFGELIPATLAQRQRLLELIDSVSVLIRAQQGQEGGLVAGHNYHIAYVRDQYGVSRCLLALGYHQEARAILGYYWDIWQRHGRLQTAQGIGADLFHIHENDGAEITGYLVIQAFDYLRETGDEAFVHRIAPMLLWAFRRQKELLVNGMLPFNGDETYIAGGMLPREAINDGSAEATMLFLTGGDLLLEWAAQNGLLQPEELSGGREALNDARARYEQNFLKNGRLIANNPERLSGHLPPRFRHGVCQVCSAFGWTERAAGGLYACPRCLQQPLPRYAQSMVHVLKSVSLMPAYIGATVVPQDLLEAVVNDIAEDYVRTGRLPSSPQGAGTVGYDYGLLLYNLAKIVEQQANAALVLDGMLAIADDTDAWVEYYRDGRPYNTRCRPWESGINLEAAIAYALSWVNS